MDIGSGKEYPSNALSNFSPHPFEIDGVKCNSMEGFLQGIKFESPEMQEYVCSLVGFGAKKKGRNKNWQQTQTYIGKESQLKDLRKSIKIYLIKLIQKCLRILNLKPHCLLVENLHLLIQLVAQKKMKQF